MKKPMIAAFIVAGICNAAVSGIIAWFAIDIAWTAGLVMASLIFLVSAVLLMRAPFSRKNIDCTAVSALRSVLLMFFLYAEYAAVKIFIEEKFDPLTLGVAITLGITITLLSLMTKIRHRVILA